jgi:hypothetical protein
MQELRQSDSIFSCRQKAFDTTNWICYISIDILMVAGKKTFTDIDQEKKLVI